jgi:hypothetical protein
MIGPLFEGGKTLTGGSLALDDALRKGAKIDRVTPRKRGDAAEQKETTAASHRFAGREGRAAGIWLGNSWPGGRLGVRETPASRERNSYSVRKPIATASQ